MAGFGRIAFEGEYYNQQIVNVLHYRSTDWGPGDGNPFDDVLAILDAVILKLKTTYLLLFPPDFTLRQVTAVGYDDHYNIVTSSPLVRTIGEIGTSGYTAGMGAAQCAILGFRLGEQATINGVGKSKRNRGYLALGPIGEQAVDNYSHLVLNQSLLTGNLGALLDDQIIMVAPSITLIPIRVHEKWQGVFGNRVLLWRTYSDILGYSVNAVASYRRSRQPEA
jgi:hypothetical protein